MQYEQDYIMRLIKQVIRALIGTLLNKRTTLEHEMLANQQQNSGDDLFQRFAVLADQGKICEAENMRDPKLLAETVAGIDKYRFELGNLLNATDFKTGFRNYLKSITQVAIKDEELDQAIAFIRQNMQDEIGTWHEPEVEKALLNWKLSITIKEKFAVTVFVDPIGSGTIYGTGTFEDGSTTNLAAVANSGYEFERWSDGDNNFSKSIVIKNDVSFTAFFKKIPAKKAPAINVKKKENVIAKVKALTDINKAKIILERIIEKGDDTIIDIINEL